MAKRLLDIFVAAMVLIITAPIQAAALLAVYLHDRQWPFYSPSRVGRNGVPFRMHKMRSMNVGADANKVDTTSAQDARITPVGATLRRYKLDELPQLWNVLVGEMSLVGPRPQIDREVRLYTEEEKGLLAVRPGVTDFASIVFSDLGEIVAASADPNIAYNQLVRPWKSRLGLFYAARASCLLDMALIALTALSIISLPAARRGVAQLLRSLGAPPELVEVSRREKPLVPTPPPGSDSIVTSRG